MSKQRVNLEEFANLVKKTYGNNPVTLKEIRQLSNDEDVCVPNTVWEHKSGRGVWDLSSLGSDTIKVQEKVATSAEVSVPVPVPVPVPVVREVLPVKEKKEYTLNFVPPKNPEYVAWGNFKDVSKIISSGLFYPIFITGLSGNGKTTMVEQACAGLRKEFIRANITVETDEDDLLGGYRLVDGNTVWHDGPVIEAMRRGGLLLLDEVDLASHKIMCLQPVLEGKPIFLKKTGELVYPKKGFNVVATANTKGKGSDDGMFMGTNTLNEAFLDRFPVTFFQDYPGLAIEKKILNKRLQSLNMQDEKFTENLAKWGGLTRSLFEEGVLHDVITTRRLVNIIESFSIFKDKAKSIRMATERFDDINKESFINLYTKIDTGVYDQEEAAKNADKVEEVEIVF